MTIMLIGVNNPVFECIHCSNMFFFFFFFPVNCNKAVTCQFGLNQASSNGASTSATCGTSEPLKNKENKDFGTVGTVWHFGLFN